MDFSNLLHNKLFYIIIIVVISIIIFLYYLKRNYSSYDFLITVLENVKGNSRRFMNFGLWEEGINTLEEANKNLCQFLFDKGGLKYSTNILDVGFGYGEQDVLWGKQTDGNITGIDINPVQVKYANKLMKEHNLENKIKCQEGNATQLQFPHSSFDTVTSVESAFHYQPRQTFFKEAYRVLKDKGKFVICDIVKNKNAGFLSYLPSKIYQYFFNVPNANMINSQEWEQQLKKEGFKVKMYDITDKTYKPYFKYFTDNFRFNNFMMDKCLDFVNTTFNICEPFSYVVAICEK